jgi:hypothetical protein
MENYDVHNMYDFVGDNEDNDREIKFPSEFVLQFNKTIEKVNFFETSKCNG